MADSSERFVLLNRLADEFAERYRRGERPTVQEYVDRHPELADDIRELFPAMAKMEQVTDDRQEVQEPLATGPLPPLERLGDYRIIREIGHGGMGVVYEAEQISLGRHVALKILPQKLLVDARTKRRFEHEAKAAARLHHTNIVPVFGVGEHEGLPYYVMQFIQGLGLDEVLEELKRMRAGDLARGAPTEGELRVARKDVTVAVMARSLLTGEFHPTTDDDLRSLAPASVAPGQATVADSPASPDALLLTGGRLSDSFTLSSSSMVLPGQSDQAPNARTKKPTYWQSVAHLGIQVAGALDYAHKQGIVHRDIKPSNLLLDTRGTVWVTDFGLAKADGAENLTHTGDVLGTLRYLPPEAFEGKTDSRSDLYALGLTLYEHLALRPAFDETEHHKLIKQVVAAEPVRLDKLNPSIPRDLVTIIHKAIGRDPAHRYASAAELAADLQRFLDDEPIHARRPSLHERYWRWCRRNPGVAALSAALILFLLSATVASLLTAAHLDRVARQAAQIADDEREARQREAEQRLRAQANLAKAAASQHALGILQSEYEDYASAKEHLEQALDLRQTLVKDDPHQEQYRTDLAETLFVLGDVAWTTEQLAEGVASWRKGLELLEQAARDQPASSSLVRELADKHLEIGDYYAELGLWHEAASHFDRGFEVQPPENPYTWFEHAYLRLPEGDYQGYRKVCERMHETFRKSEGFDGMGLLAHACVLAPEALRDRALVVQLAQERFVRQSQVAGHEEWTEHVLGLAHYRAGQYDQAIQRLTKPMDAAADKDMVANWLVLALAHYRKGQHLQGKQWLDKAKQSIAETAQDISDDPKSVSPSGWLWRDWLGLHLLRREAETLIEGKAGPDDARLHLVRGWAYSQLEQWEKAQAEFQLAIDLGPKNPSVWKERARAHVANGQPDKAAADFDKALSLAPAPTDFFDLWYHDQDRIEDEVVLRDDVFQRVVALRPNDRRLLLARLIYHGRRGQWQEAAKLLPKVIELDPTDHYGWFHQAIFCLYLGDSKGYRKACRELMERFGKGEDSPHAEYIARTCLLMPDTIPDLQPILRVAARALASNERTPHHQWSVLTQGMADYREGQFAKVIERLGTSLARGVHSEVYCEVMARLFLAMALHRSGQPDQAHQTLNRARATMQQRFPKLEREELIGRADWREWLPCQLIRREAEALIEGKKGGKK